MKPKRKKRICVKCKDPLGRQRTYHVSTKVQSHSGAFVSYWCIGPRTTPLTEPLVSRRRLPVHYAQFGDSGHTICGRETYYGTSGKYRKGPDAVPIRRSTVKLDNVTCVECLVWLKRQITERADKGLRAWGRSEEDAYEVAEGRNLLLGLRRMTGADT